MEGSPSHHGLTYTNMVIYDLGDFGKCHFTKPPFFWDDRHISLGDKFMGNPVGFPHHLRWSLPKPRSVTTIWCPKRW